MGVCVIDDSDDWLGRMRTVIAEAGGLHYLGSAANPVDALELIGRTNPQIVILDLFLPEGSGVEVLRRLKCRNPSPQVVVVTGEPSEQLKGACLALGARYFFDKALEFDRIGGVLRALQSNTTAAELKEG
jgi:DNA-binding NarL/FixJ family response regulator